jgi:hypothetical protein
MTTYLGIVDEVRTPVSGPKAFLRPVFKAEQGKSRWEVVESDEFPNRGLASWWKPPPTVLKGTAWIFRVHESETFEQENQYHNFFNVSEPADAAMELIDAAGIHKEEDLRTELCSIGLAGQSPLTTRVLIRFGGDRLLGPVHIALRDGRLYLPNETLNSHLTIGLAGSLESLAKYDGHCFLPPGDWSQKIGEVDFSPDSVFLKRALKDLRSKDVASIKLTDSLMRQLVSGAADTSLTVLERQRLERLRAWTATVDENVTLTEVVINEILELPAIRKEVAGALETARDDARRAIEKELTDELKKIAATRTEVATLIQERDKLLGELGERRRKQELFANELESSVEERIRSVMEKPHEFLAENALLRAALSVGAPNTTTNLETPPTAPTQSEDLIGDHEELVQLLKTVFLGRGFEDRLPLALHATLLAGNIPLLYGVHAREVLYLYSRVITSGNILWISIAPSYLEPADLLVSRAGGSRGNTPNPNGLLDLLKRAQSSDAMYLVVCEGVNRCFMQSAVWPIFRHVVDRKQGTPTGPLITGSQLGNDPGGSLGLYWPPNVLLAGTIVDERSLYPMDLSTWEVANWVFTDPHYHPEKRDLDNLAALEPGLVGADADSWSKWAPKAKQVPSGDLKVFLRLTGDKLLLDSSFYSSSTRLHLILTELHAAIKSPDLLLYLSELTLLPRCSKQQGRLKEILDAPPFELWQKIKGADILQRLNAPSIADIPDSDKW